MKIGDKSVLHCTRCDRATEHTVLYTDQRDEDQSDPTGRWSLDHTLTRGLVECFVCSWPKLRVHVFTLPIEEEELFSIPPEPARPVPHWVKRLPEDVRQELLEVYTASLPTSTIGW